uniref:Myb/SANT-like domain-containing protein n=1 Tax=Lactuca sativa TaxID=4236 RepID=A0A9R1X133_LACSA|nr:hypothetical protein LSAT_V11C800392590 [Lactuca sativa]
MDSDQQTPAQFLRVRQMQVVYLIYLLMAILTHRALANTNRPKLPSRKLILKRRRIHEQLLHDLSNGGQCRELIRMSEQAFKKLYTILQEVGDRDKNLEDEVLQEMLNEPREEMRHNIRETNEGNAAAERMRNLIANQMWTDYLPNRNHEINMSIVLTFFVLFIFWTCHLLIICTSSKYVIMMKEERVAKKEQIKWTDWMDYCFIQSMMTQDEKGLRISGSFIPQAYNNMVKELNQKFGKSLTKNHLKNRLKNLKSGFSQWYDMFRGTSLSGFGWNSETQLIEVDEEVWANLINSKPDAISLKSKKIPNYNEMIALFAKDRASGVHRIGDIKVETIEEVDKLLASNDITLDKQQKNNDDDDGLDDIQVSKMYKSKKRKHEIEDEDELEAKPESFEKVIMSAVKDVASTMREGNIIFENSHHRVYTGDEIYKELEPMDLEPDEVAEALMFLSRNQSDVGTLFRVPFKIRKSLLKKMMGASK